MEAKNLYPKSKPAKAEPGKPSLKEGEETETISFKVPKSLWNKIMSRLERLGFWSKSEYIRHAIEIEMGGGKQTRTVNRLTRVLNDTKKENIDLRDKLARQKRYNKRKGRYID
jgi:Arc/MetJ-type ribon-helix-helix transcriptional regulator